LQGLDWQLPISEPVVATVRVPRACIGAASAAAVLSGNSKPLPASKTSAGRDIRAFRPYSSRDFSHSGHLIPFVLTTVSLSLVPIDRLIHDGSHVHGLAHE
jgi:hypothetical protein